MKKKYLLITGVIFLFLALIVGGFFVFKGKKQKEDNSPSLTPQEEVKEVPLEERPYVVLIPRADGKEFTMEVSRFGDASTLEYELVYLSQGLTRGVVGTVSLNGEKKVSRKLLLGSCSRNVCKYDEGVEKGTLTLRLRGEGGSKKFTVDFHLQQGGEELTSTDGKFKLKGSFPKNSYYVVMSTLGLPELTSEKIIAGPWGVFTSINSRVKAEVWFEEMDSDKKVLVWKNSSWQKLKDHTTDFLSAFILVE